MFTYLLKLTLGRRRKEALVRKQNAHLDLQRQGLPLFLVDCTPVSSLLSNIITLLLILVLNTRSFEFIGIWAMLFCE